MPRRAAKVDQNQAAIVQALRACGASVLHTHTLGRGAPDLVVGWVDRETGERKALLVEIKDGSKPASAQALTPDEERFEEQWEGPYRIVRSVDDALRAVGLGERNGE